MAVSVDRVYQTVLAVANKEQRGYITPQEFNLFANHAQNSIFEQYFYDLNQVLRIPGNETITADPRDIIEEKISRFRNQGQITTNFGANTSMFPEDMYRLESLIAIYKDKYGKQHYTFVEEVSAREIYMYDQSDLLKPPINRPIFYRSSSGLDSMLSDMQSFYTMPSPWSYEQFFVEYIRRPRAPKWTYVVIQGKAIWNPGASDMRNFELHPSEEKNLVVKILQLAGVATKDYNLTQMASQEEVKNIQLEKS